MTITRGAAITFRLNGQIIHEGGGKIELRLRKNEEYKLSWEITGKPDSRYTISVSPPISLEFSVDDILEKSGKKIHVLHFET